jgi:hypothetical protein
MTNQMMKSMGMKSQQVAALSERAKSFPYLGAGLDTTDVEDGAVYTGYWQAHGHERIMSPQYLAGNSILWSKKYPGYGPKDFAVHPLTRAKSMQIISRTNHKDKVTEGFGNFKFEDGAVYSGEFQNRAITGEGKYTWRDGRTYTGQFRGSELHGEGTFTWPDGRVYKGQYESNIRNGEGTMKWKDGRSYTGTWKGGKPADGNGEWTTKRGNKNKGTWVDGRRGWWIWPQEDPWGMHAHSTVTLPRHLTLRDAPK